MKKIDWLNVAKYGLMALSAIATLTVGIIDSKQNDNKLEELVVKKLGELNVPKPE